MDLTLDVLAGRLAVVRLAADAEVPAWVSGPVVSVTRRAAELSIVCADDAVPADVRAERGWRAFVVAGPLDFSLTGVLAALTAPLADAEVPVFALSTYDTDLLLVRERDFDRAAEALRAAGHAVDA